MEIPKRQSLVLIDVFYFLPDHPKIIQEFSWQTLDIIPELIRVKKFLNYWDTNIEARIFEVILSGINGPGKKTYRSISEITIN